MTVKKHQKGYVYVDQTTKTCEFSFYLTPLCEKYDLNVNTVRNYIEGGWVYHIDFGKFLMNSGIMWGKPRGKQF
jgi:hypothetical protein